jgi:hypothetical protein
MDSFVSPKDEIAMDGAKKQNLTLLLGTIFNVRDINLFIYRVSEKDCTFFKNFSLGP